MALYGSDGNDCAPGHIVQCGGIVTAAQPYQGSSYYYYNNAIYNEGTPSSGGSNWLEWQSMSAVAGDGVCENTECGASVTFPGTAQCGVDRGLRERLQLRQRRLHHERLRLLGHLQRDAALLRHQRRLHRQRLPDVDRHVPHHR